ncbi:hypothetical protein NDU88_000053 [Pleurodeles waltl]|uniref:Uncharacterized protein n=1 Tax=Pleurodeles waltl TaxID=8319 RepID=A0AAV7VWA2_PLEWA|nr:hypothetical protein NDU88_000053 [Pleurodeles waltl]
MVLSRKPYREGENPLFAWNMLTVLHHSDPLLLATRLGLLVHVPGDVGFTCLYEVGGPVSVAGRPRVP